MPTLLISRIHGLTSALADKATINQLNAEIATLNQTIADLRAELDSKRDYEHIQSVPLATWTISHNLGRYPALFIKDSFNQTVEGGELDHIDRNTLTVTFSGAFSGKAILS